MSSLRIVERNLDTLNYMKSFLDSLMEKHNYGYLYIGATSDYTERFHKYPEIKYKKTISGVIDNFNDAEYLEEQLINYAIAQGYPVCNDTPESKGLDKNEHVFYIYVAADDKKCANE